MGVLRDFETNEFFLSLERKQMSRKPAVSLETKMSRKPAVISLAGFRLYGKCYAIDLMPPMIPLEDCINEWNRLATRFQFDTMREAYELELEKKSDLELLGKMIEKRVLKAATVKLRALGANVGDTPADLLAVGEWVRSICGSGVFTYSVDDKIGVIGNVWSDDHRIAFCEQKRKCK